MENIYAVVLDGVVINIVVWDGESEWTPDVGVAIPTLEYVSIGWGWDGKEFTEPKEDEKTSDELYKDELKEINLKYKNDTNSLSSSYATAALADGPGQEVKQMAIYQQYNSTKSQYISDLASLKVKYGV